MLRMWITHRRMHPSPTDGAPNPTPLEAEVVKSEVIDALDAATPKRGGFGLLVDTFPQDTQDAIRRASARKVSNRQIAEILTAQGMACSEGAVRTWLRRNG